MVQISKSLIVAAAILPALAAPANVESTTLEAREPLRLTRGGLRTVGKVGGKVFDGLSLGGSVAPLFMNKGQQQQQPRGLENDEQLEARKFPLSIARAHGHGSRLSGGLRMPNRLSKIPVLRHHISKSQFKSLGHKAGRLGHSAKSGAELGETVGSLAQNQQDQDQPQARFTDEELVTRAPLGFARPRISPAQLRAVGHGLAQAGHHAKGGIEFGAAVAPLIPSRNQNQPRSEEELVERDPRGGFRISRSGWRKAGGLAAGAAGFGGAVAASKLQPQQRDFEDSEIEAREPNLPGFIKRVKVLGNSYVREDESDILTREYEDVDMEARDNELDLDMREFADFDELD